MVRSSLVFYYVKGCFDSICMVVYLVERSLKGLSNILFIVLLAGVNHSGAHIWFIFKMYTFSLLTQSLLNHLRFSKSVSCNFFLLYKFCVMFNSPASGLSE